MGKGKILVIGSYNAGLFLKGDALPGTGETVMGHTFFESGGGKGSNQAIASSCMGADVTFAGRIGEDEYGKTALKIYAKYGLCADKIIVDNSTHTGMSVILIDKNGQNSIMVVPGANYNLSKSDMDAALADAKDYALVGFQLENNVDTVLYGIRKAAAAGADVLLDPAPAVPLPVDIYPFITYIKPNEHEAAILSGIPVHDAESAYKAGEWFLKQGAKNAVITLGSGGTVLVNADGKQHFKTPKVNAVDTTGAGDCFSGAMMSALTKGETIADAIKFANCASALSVTRFGVVEAIPSLDEVISFQKNSSGV